MQRTRSTAPARAALPAFLSALALVMPALSQSPRTQPPRTWTVDDVVDQEQATSWQLSDDGSHALWLRRRPDPEKDRQLATLMLTDLTDLADGARHRELTVGRFPVSSPAFAPDGQRIAFLSSAEFPDGVDGPDDDDRGSQVWLLDLRGGAPRPLTRIDHGVQSFAWKGDDALVLLARERKSRRELESDEKKDDSRVVEDRDLWRDARSRLFEFTLEGAKLRRLTTNDLPIASFSLSPDGRRAVAMHSRSPSFEALSDEPPRCFVHDLETGTARELYPDRRSKPSGFAWRPDGSGLFVRLPTPSVDGQDWAAVERLAEVEFTADGWSIRDVDLGTDRGLQEMVVPRADGFVAALMHGVEPVWARFVRRPDGSYERRDLRPDLELPLHDLIAAPRADTVLVIQGDASTPDHVRRASLGGADLADLADVYRAGGDGFEGLRHAHTEILDYEGAQGDRVEAILYHPLDRPEGQRAPLVLVTHGGPHAHDPNRFTERWANTPNLYTSRGAFVLKVNYHGSSGYGLAFGESIKGRYYELELVDLFAGIRLLVDRGLVDPDRLGLVGWSNGAILSLAALTHGAELAPGYDYQFKACAPGAGDVNWTSDFGNCAFGAGFDEFYLGGTPWTNPAGYLAKSPLFRIDTVTTPTLVFFGTDDTAVPTEQGWQQFRALQRVGKAPVRFVLFPGEGHGLQKLSHQRRKLVEELAWFDRHLFGVEANTAWDERVVADGSPLEALELRVRLPRHDGKLGVPEGNALVPETVALRLAGETVHVGRCEVTRAQWQSFRADRDPGGLPDHPVTAITADDVTAYLEWLQTTTGSRWRLLTAKEHEALPAGPSPHDLDALAGYAPSHDDATRLAERIRGIGPDRALRAVDDGVPGAQRREGTAAVFVFHARGNAAEWIDVDGKPSVNPGGHVLAASDDRGDARDREVPPAFVGLRVVRIRD